MPPVRAGCRVCPRWNLYVSIILHYSVQFLPTLCPGLAYHFNMAGAESINKDKKRILFVKIDKYILTIIEKCVTITLN